MNFVKAITEEFQKQKDSFYYKIIGFIFMLAITVLSIVFSVNANIIKEYNDYNWYNPVDILAFVDKQIEISEQPDIVDLDPIRPDSTKLSYTHLFVVDRTVSTELSDDLKEYTQKLRDAVVNFIKKHAMVDQAKLDQLNKISLQELMCLKMNLSLYEEKLKNRALDIKTGIVFYDGEDTGSSILQPLYSNTNSQPYLEKIALDQKENIGSLCSQAVDRFTDPRIAKDNRDFGIADRTNFKEFFDEITDKYLSLEGVDTQRIILTLFSDFHHDEKDVQRGNLKNVRFDKVEQAVKRLAAGNKIFQINLVRLPMSEPSAQDEAEIEELLNKIKHFFANTFYYHVDAPRLVQEQDINERIKEIIMPTIKHSATRLVFYFPYTDHKLGIIKETKTRFRLHCPRGKKHLKHFISLHSSENINENANTSLVFKIDDPQLKEKVNLKMLKIGEHMQTDYKDGEVMRASFFNANNVQQYSDLSLNVFPFGTGSKIRYPIIFRERLSLLNAELLGAACLSTIISFIVFLLFVVFDPILRKNNNLGKKALFSALHLGLAVLFILVIWSGLAPSLNFNVLRIPILFSVLAIAVFYLQGFLDAPEKQEEGRDPVGARNAEQTNIDQQSSKYNKMIHDVQNMLKLGMTTANKIYENSESISKSSSKFDEQIDAMKRQIETIEKTIAKNNHRSQNNRNQSRNNQRGKNKNGNNGRTNVNEKKPHE